MDIDVHYVLLRFSATIMVKVVLKLAIGGRVQYLA